MWNTFLESVTIFKEYVGYNQNKFLFGIYLFFFLYLWMKEKDKKLRTLFVYLPTLLLICFFCPIFRKLYIRLVDDAGTYYRFLWLLQMSLVSAYGALKLCGRFRKTMLAVMCIAIAACGSLVYQSVYITKAQNYYHIPNEVVEVVDLIEPEEMYTTALIPAEMIHFIRQYSTKIQMPYGRDILGWNYHNDLYEEMENTEVIETSSLVEMTRDYGCEYIVLWKGRQIKEPLTDYGFTLYAQTANYLIYQDLSSSSLSD